MSVEATIPWLPSSACGASDQRATEAAETCLKKVGRICQRLIGALWSRAGAAFGASRHLCFSNRRDRGSTARSGRRPPKTR
jgi:hypothetical protein